MPTNYHTWDGDNKRWRVQLDGTRLVRSVRQLKKDGYLAADAPETKEGSHRAFNRWLDDRRVGPTPAPEGHPHSPTLEVLAERLAWAEAQRQGDLAESVRETIDLLEGDRGGDLARMSLSFLGDQSGQAVWRDRLTRQPIEPVPADMTVGHHADNWLGTQKRRAEAGQISPAEWSNRVYQLEHFTKFLGKFTPVTTLDEKAWVGYYDRLLTLLTGGEMSATYAQKCQRIARYFCEYLSNLRLIELPRNLADRTLTFKVTPGEIVTFTQAEVKSLLDNATGQLHLHLLLMLNCGFTQVDIAKLRHAEVNWEAGTITRRRSKTKAHKGVPTVTYRLWGRTFVELKTWRSGHPTLALVTKSGKPWVDKEFKDSDLVRQNYDRLADRLGITKTLKHFRKTSASQIYNKSEYSRYNYLFLGQSERTIAQIHYTAHDQAEFDRCLAWLETQYEF